MRIRNPLKPELQNQTMRRLLPPRLNSRLVSPSQRRRAWLALWAQDRRRSRALAHVVTPLSGLRPGLVGYYNLDEPNATDDAVDSAGGMGAMFVASGAPASMAGPGLHLARDFSGGGSLVQSVDFDGFTGPPFSVNFWIFQNSNGGQYPFDCSNAASQGFTCFLATDGMYVNMYAFTPGYDSPGTIQTSGNYGAWVMFTLIWTGAEFRYYENGELIGADEFIPVGAFATSVAPFQISAGFLPVDGAMALFGVWQRALGVAEVTQLFNNGDGLSFAEL